MTVKTDRNTMHGPFMRGVQLDDKPGVYLVLGDPGLYRKEPDVLEVVACDAVRSHIIEHQETGISNTWGTLDYDLICFGAIYVDGSERDAFAQELRVRYRLVEETPQGVQVSWLSGPVVAA